jgi:hypothetical protein
LPLLVLQLILSQERLIGLAQQHQTIASDTTHYKQRLEPERVRHQKLSEDFETSSEECADWTTRVVSPSLLPLILVRHLYVW